MSQVGWISGSVAESRAALSQIKKQFDGHEIVHFNSEVSYAYLEHTVLNGSCFSERRLFIVEELPIHSVKATMITKLKKLLEGLPPDVVLIFHGISPTEEANLFGHVQKIGGKVVHSPTDLKPDDAPGWVIGEAEQRGKTLEREQADLLIQLCGFDPDVNNGKGGLGVDRLRNAIEKLCLYVGSRKKVITFEDIEVTSFISEENLRFNSMFDALDSKDIERCYKTFSKMLLEEDNVKGALERLFATSLWRYRLLVMLKEGLAQNKTKQEVAKEALSMIRLNQSGAGMGMVMTAKDKDDDGNSIPPPKAWPEFAINQALGLGFGNGKAAIEAYSRKELIRLITALQEGMVETRARSSEESLWLVVDALFLSVCTKTDDKHLSAIRNAHEF